MNIDTVLIIFMVLLSVILAIGFLKLTHENPNLLGIGDYRWDKFVRAFQPKRNYSIFEDPEEDK
jgi:hypothetical protein